MTIRFGTRTFEYPSNQLGQLVDSSPDLGDGARLRSRLEEDGYLFLRGVIDRSAVLKARERVMRFMAEREALTPGAPVLEGVMPKGGKTVNLMGNRSITHQPEVLRVLEAPELFELFGRLYDEEAATFSYKWMRGVGNEKFSGAHYDVVYMGRGSSRVNTVWIPLGDVPVHQGTLAICEGSHRLSGFHRLRETYGRMDVDRDHVEGWFSEDPLEITTKFGGRWLTEEMHAGDILTFGLYTMHASTTNTTDRYRLSCDVRFQPGSEPMDERWIGTNPRAHYGWHDGTMVSMAEARASWGV